MLPANTLLQGRYLITRQLGRGGMAQPLAGQLSGSRRCRPAPRGSRWRVEAQPGPPAGDVMSGRGVNEYGTRPPGPRKVAPPVLALALVLVTGTVASARLWFAAGVQAGPTSSRLRWPSRQRRSGA